MNDLHKALGDIGAIRREMARSTQFRGYGALTLAATSTLAVLAAVLQSALVRDPAHHVRAYVGLWSVTALLSIVLTGVEMSTRTRRIHSGLSDEMIHLAVEQFLPSLGAGVLVTFAVAIATPQIAWMLPGLWQVIFSLGVFSSCRFLPRPMLAAGGWYLITGFVGLLLGPRALHPWTMGLGFGAGQLIVAGVLLWAAKESSHES